MFKLLTYWKPISDIFSQDDIDMLKQYSSYNEDIHMVLYSKSCGLHIKDCVYHNLMLPLVIINLIIDYFDMSIPYKFYISNNIHSYFVTIDCNDFYINYVCYKDTNYYVLHLLNIHFNIITCYRVSYDPDIKANIKHINASINLTFDILNDYMKRQYNKSFCSSKPVTCYKLSCGYYRYMQPQGHEFDIIIIKNHTVFNKIMLICKILYNIF